MSDAAFTTAPFPAYTTQQLREMLKDVEHYKPDQIGYVKAQKIQAEIERRDAVNAGDKSVMTPGELLRFAKTGKAR